MTSSSSSAASNKAVSRTQATPVVVPIRSADSDPLEHFPQEGAQPTVAITASPAPKARSIAAQSTRVAAITVSVAAGLVLIAGVMIFRYWDNRAASPAPIAAAFTGKATLNSRPAGAAVIIDGAARGVTPLEIDLPVGPHEVLFHSDTGERRLTVNIERSTRVSENVDMPTAGIAATGEIDVASDPSGARVTLDNTNSGKTPLQLKSLMPGQHTLEFTHGTKTVTRVVDLAAGGSLNVFVSLAPAGAESGTFAVDSPVELRLIENGQLLGVSGAAPLTLAAGSHKFEFVNEQLELTVSRTVDIERGKAARISVPVPNGTVFVNAAPWAEVFIDGKSVGLTPLGNLAVPVGTHEFTWRHPQLGDRQRTVIVGARNPVRLSLDFAK